MAIKIKSFIKLQQMKSGCVFFFLLLDRTENFLKMP